MLENKIDINGIDCFAKCTKGCTALSYSIAELSPEICLKCKFRRGTVDWLLRKRKLEPSRVKGFNLIFDNENEGFFKTIKEIDEWLEKYWSEHFENEVIPYDCEFSDYNVLFYNHKIEFKVI